MKVGYQAYINRMFKEITMFEKVFLKIEKVKITGLVVDYLNSILQLDTSLPNTVFFFTKHKVLYLAIVPLDSR